jgi:uncharacterized membrane protein
VSSIYTLFKYLHIVGAIVWIGGAFTLVVINWRLARLRDHASMDVLARISSFVGPAMLGPAMLLTLVAGIVTAASVGMNFGVLWISWGFTGIIVSFLIGGLLVRRTAGQLGALAATAEPGDARVASLQARLALLNVINLLVLLSTVGAMVFKPTL